jgi:hypothetical protein
MCWEYTVSPTIGEKISRCLNADHRGPSRVMWHPPCGPTNKGVGAQVKHIAKADFPAEAN